jgi:hypothetical protein
VIAVAENFDATTPEGEMARNMFLSVNHMYWRRARLGFANAKRQVVVDRAHLVSVSGLRAHFAVLRDPATAPPLLSSTVRQRWHHISVPQNDAIGLAPLFEVGDGHAAARFQLSEG